jgi:hypothetical protein
MYKHSSGFKISQKRIIRWVLEKGIHADPGFSRTELETDILIPKNQKTYPKLLITKM